MDKRMYWRAGCVGIMWQAFATGDVATFWITLVIVGIIMLAVETSRENSP